MAATSDLIAHLDELLDPGAFDDLGPNGLQVPGRTEIRRVVTGVTAQRALFERAIEAEADLGIIIGNKRPGETVTLELLRDGERRTIDVKLDERPEQVDRP